jgi:hypothetical protein
MNVPQWPRYPRGLDFVSFDQTPAGVTPEIVVLKAEDGGISRGVLYSTGKERTVVCLMHPRADMTRHYLIPSLVENGYAFFAQESRWPGTDIATIHEVLLADVAAAMVQLRARNFASIVLLGNSGAGSLYCLYQAQAVTAPPGRLTDTAAGDPYDLNAFTMPPADGMIFLGAHLGAGKILQTEIDPAVIDENDPLSCDPELNMYRPANGFREPPEYSTYSDEFLARYRNAQVGRVERIDAIAREHIRNPRPFRYLQVFRLDANPGSTSRPLPPSRRTYGSLMSVRPDLSNVAEPGTKVLSPRAWLSSWSGLSSRASVLHNLPMVTIPTLVANYDADNAIYPASSETIFEASPASDKSRAQFEGDHFGLTAAFERKPRGPKSAATVILEWLRARY